MKKKPRTQNGRRMRRPYDITVAPPVGATPASPVLTGANPQPGDADVAPTKIATVVHPVGATHASPALTGANPNPGDAGVARTKIATIDPPVGAPHASPAFDRRKTQTGRRMRRPYETIIIPAAANDWQAFQVMAQQEGWRVPQRELDLHRQGGCSQAWALRDHETTIGLVTGVRHQHSAWIGNLIIAPTERGRGYGAALFDHAVRELRAAGVVTLWLTASASGAPLYAARGFLPVGQVERWVRREGGRGEKSPCPRVNGEAVDSVVWGDDRRPLLRHLESAGSWWQQGESLALLQNGDDLQIIGPWYGSTQPQDDAELLARLVAVARPQQELVLDLLGHTGREELLAAAGFVSVGSTALMVAGQAQVQWSRLFALATLGSCG